MLTATDNKHDFPPHSADCSRLQNAIVFLLRKEFTLDTSASPVRAPRQVLPGIRGHGIRIISQIIWSPQPGSSSNDFRERRSTIRKRGTKAEQITQGQSLCLSQCGVCRGRAGGGSLFLSSLEKKGRCFLFPLFFFSSHFQMLPTLAGVIQRDPLEIAKRLARRRHDGAAHFGGGGVSTPRYAASNRGNTFRYH